MRTANVCPTCQTYVNAACVIYNGEYLEILDIEPGDNLQDIIEIINNFLDGISVVIPEIPGFTLDEALDNQYHYRRYGIDPDVYDGGNAADVATVINNGPAFSVNEIQIPVFKMIDFRRNLPGEFFPPPLYAYIWTLKEPYGKGDYGTGSGTTLTFSDLILWSTTVVQSQDIPDIDTTQFVNLGDIGSSTIAEAVNALIPCVTVQPQNDGYTIFQAIIDSNPVEYLFLGIGSTYGSGCNTVTDLDFAEFDQYFEDNTSIITNTSQLINDGENGSDPFITASEVFTPNSIINNQAGVNHVANYSFEAWARSYYINNVRYNNEYVINNVELSNSHPTLDRKDTFVIQNYTPSVGIITLQSGGAGQMTTIEVDGTDILGVPVAFNTDLATTATYVVNQINTYCIANELPFNARNDDESIYIYDRTGAANDGQVLSYTATTIVCSTANFTGGNNNVKTTAAITGIAAVSPYEPVPLFSYQTRISAIDVFAGTTDPGTQIFTQSIYDEDAGTGGGEWDQGLTTVGIDVASTSIPADSQSSGPLVIEIPSSISPLLSQQVIFQDLGNPLPFDFVQGKIKFLFWTTSIILTNQWQFELTLQNSASSNFVTVTLDYLGLITHGWGIQAGTWYTITVNLSEFQYLTDGEFDRVYFKFTGAPQCYIDKIDYQTGLAINQPGITPNLQQVTDIDNITTNTMQTPSILSDQLTQTNWFRVTKDYFSLGDWGDGAGSTYGGSWNKYIAIFDPTYGTDFVAIHNNDGTTIVDLVMGGNFTYMSHETVGSNRIGTVRLDFGAPSLEKTVGANTASLGVQDPVVNNHTYLAPARTDVATTSFLAIGATDGTTDVYAGTDGLINISTLTTTANTLDEVLDAGNQSNGTIEMISLGNTGTAFTFLNLDSAGLALILSASGPNSAGMIRFTNTGTGEVQLQMPFTSTVTDIFTFPTTAAGASNYLAIGVTDGTTDVYTGANGLVDISSITTLDTVTDNGNSTTNSISVNTITTITYTVAGLPSGTIGQRSFVTDSSVAAAGNFGAIVAGGGANGVPVYYDGSNWRIG